MGIQQLAAWPTKITSCVKTLPALEAAPQLWKLENPSAAAWRDAEPELTRVITPRQMTLRRRPVLFVHGVEYANTAEVLRDLVIPFERASGLNHRRDRYDYFFVTWNSLLFSDDVRQRIFTDPLAKLLTFGLGVFLWKRFLSDMERRAEETADYLAPFYHELITSSRPRAKPLVITHSIGSYLWSHLIASMAKKGELPGEPGPWWNMQAAVKRGAFCHGGEFAEIPRIYSGGQNSSMLLWYSRFDCILSTLYLVAKPGLAMGQFGSTNSRVYQRDVTRWAGEAHGRNRLVAGAGHYFERVKHMIQHETLALGLV